MKWVKIGLGVVAALIVLPVLALGIANLNPDSNRLNASVVIHQKPAAIWPWLHEPAKLKQWVSWMVEVRQEGTNGLEPGHSAVWVMEDRNNGNARIEIKSVVESVEPMRRFTARLSATEGFSGNVTYSLTELPDGSTRVESDSRYHFDSAMVRFMMPLVCWQAKKKMVTDLDQLRQHVEGGI